MVTEAGAHGFEQLAGVDEIVMMKVSVEANEPPGVSGGGDPGLGGAAL